MAWAIRPELTLDGIAMLREALDPFEYRQLGDELPRHDGLVWLPRNAVDGDRF